VLGSAILRLHGLVTGYYTVHTNRHALDRGEATIRRSALDCSVRAGCASRSVSDSIAGQSKETCIRSDVRLRLRVIEEVTREHRQPQLCERLG
jgi:hypothetical protein